jgi:hypothetical protein
VSLDSGLAKVENFDVGEALPSAEIGETSWAGSTYEVNDDISSMRFVHAG